MSQGRIDDFVTDRGFGQLDQLLEKLGITREAIASTSAEVIKFNNAIAGSQTLQEYAKNSVNASEALDKVEKSVEKARLAEIRLQQAREKAFDDYEKKLAKQTAANIKANSEYLKLVNSLKLAERAAQDAGAKFGVASQQYIQAAESANKIRSEIEAIDKPLNTFTNNTDRYTKGIIGFFGKAYSGIRTLANIIPAFGIGTAFLFLFEGIKKAADMLGLFNTQVSDAQKNLSNLNSVVQSANKSAADQATNLKILYAAATDVNNSYNQRIAAAEELKKQFPDTYKNDSDLAIISGQLSAQTQQLTKDIYENARARAAASKISELAAQQLDIDFQKQKIIAAKNQEIANVKPSTRAQSANTDAVGGFLTPAQQQASVRAQQQTLRDLLRGELEQQDAKRKSLQNQIDFLTKFAGGNNKIAQALSTGNTPTDKKTDPKTQLEEQLKAIKLAEDKVLEDENSTYEERIAATTAFYNTSYDLIKRASDKNVLTQIETSNKLSEIDLSANRDRLKIRQVAEKKLLDSLKEGLRGQEDAERASIEAVQDAGSQKVAAIQQNAADAEEALAKQYADGLINQKEYQTQLTAIEDQADIDGLDQEIITAKAIIDIRKGLLAFGIGSAKELQSAEDKLQNLKIQRTKSATKAVLDGLKTEGDARQQLHQREKELAESSLALIQEVVDSGYQSQIQKLQDVANQIDENANHEKQQVNNSILSSKEKARQTAVIDAQAQQKKQQLEQESKKLQEKQAETDRLFTIAKIIEQTAIAAIAALAPPPIGLGPVAGIPLAAVVSAIGAAQIATVLATPLPKYEKGGTVKKDGPIITGEAGTELRIDPSGKMSLTDDHANISYAKAGTKIISNRELVKMLGKPEQVAFISSSTGDNKKMEKLLTEINAGIRQQRRPVVNVNNGKWGQFSYTRNF